MTNIERKNYTLTVYNTLTRKNEEIEVSEEVYQTYRRTAWNIDDNNTSFYAHEIQMSSLIGGEDGAYENFREFIDTENTPDVTVLRELEKTALHRIIAQLSESEQKLIRAIYFDGLTEREYADLLGVCRNAVHKRKIRILSKIRKTLKI
ncbi:MULTISPECIES: RNA polymerase sigma factor [unclassified Ruminococcus]|uniref:RNA polymerase sigma factor n=1 Tax=unclassified Ruminococcus TaxID=2608920 RepID=UPI0021087448|nr:MULTISPECIES: sigma-70 family RNA polymerase sigma factor [unclassified Ruminococcus]MCQ4022351.1 sigma-70 family RNA polymerase sigma factor [Ruminococcus sp. zg-924]MCQ4114679.1 sigma-70 family RNA polymerase sigma factor [Ruminococcus sp. zg-921]